MPLTPRADKAALLAETRFSDVLDLARLPYFELEDGQLRLADPSLGPVVDVHTHLALTFVRPPRVDLLRETLHTEHYLPMRDRPLDLEVYVNKCFTQDDLRRMNRDLVLGSFADGGMRATHTLPNLEREMRPLGITTSVLLAIDWPRPLSKNAETWLETARGREGFVVFGSVHPLDWDMEGRLDAQVRAGARGIKIHPAVQTFPPSAGPTLRLLRACAKRRLPVLYHCGPVGIEPRLQRALTQVRLYERAVAECPETTIVLGHSGALQMEEGLSLGKRFRNVWLEVSSQSLSNVRRILAEADPDRVLYGTDWPFYHQAIQLAKVLIATEGDDALRRKVLHQNAMRLLGAPGSAATSTPA